MIFTQTHTQEEKKAYFQNLRTRWAESKKLATNDETAQALYKEAQASTKSGKFSYWSFYFTLQDMKKEGFSGIPYIDCKTFQGWKESGFMVKKGEKSRIDGIVWLQFGSNGSVGNDIDPTEEETHVYPKLYHLFHTSQVESIA